MRLLTLIFVVVLLREAYALKCYKCVTGSPGTCTDTENCPLQDNQCGALRILTYIGSSLITEVNMKSCVSTEQCVEGSLNFGVSSTVITSKCCTTELCNTLPAPARNKSNPNGKKCFSCNGKMCTTTLNCKGDEDHCISTTVTNGAETIRMKGCASRQMCSNNAQVTGSTMAEISCCQGNFCNSAGSTRAGLLLLVAPLLSLVMIS